MCLRPCISLVLLALACTSTSDPTPMPGGMDSGVKPMDAAPGRDTGDPDTGGPLPDANGDPDAGPAAGKARGALSIDFRAPAGCTATAKIINLPAAAGRVVTAAEHAELMTDDGFTENHSSGVDCSTIAVGDGRFAFYGRIFFDRPMNADVSVNARLRAGETAAGGLVINHPDLPHQYGSQAAHPCSVSVSSIEAGKFWGQVTCPALPNFTDSTLCEAGPSYFYFEGCKVTQ